MRGKYLALDKPLFRSAAYRDLSQTARCLLNELIFSFNGSNNGDVWVSYADAIKDQRVGRSTLARAFDDLESHGFIKKNMPGGYATNGGKATTWILTMEDFGKSLATREYLKFHPLKKAEKSRPSKRPDLKVVE